MKAFWFGQAFPLLAETPGGGGGGGDAGSGAGSATGTGQSTGTPAGSAPSAAAGAGSAPQVWDASDDSLIRIKGRTEPVKFGEYTRGLQGQFTRASQEAAELRKQVAQFKQQQEHAQREAQQRSAQQSGNVLEAFAAKPYITGQEMAQVLQTFQQVLGQRDQVLTRALQEIQGLRGVVGGLHSTHTTQAFDNKIAHWVREGGYPDEMIDAAKELYLAYEGDDLDQEFPAILKAAVDRNLKIADAMRQKTIAANRKQPFLPGRGGAASPSKPLEINPKASSRQIGEELWDLAQAMEQT